MSYRFLGSLILAVSCVFAASSIFAAEVTPAGIFTDHMVLQRDKPVPVWGVRKRPNLGTHLLAPRTCRIPQSLP